MKQIKIAIVMDPLESINIKKDSTYAMIKEASLRNWQILCCTPSDLYVDNSIPKAIFTEIIFQTNSTPNTNYNSNINDNQTNKSNNSDKTNQNNNWYEIKQLINVDLRELDIILMRKDPPFDLEYLYCTHILDLAQRSGVLIANNPTAIRNNNEKLATLNYPTVTAPNLVTANKTKLLDFLQQHHIIIVKPLDGMGGQSIFKITTGDPNTSVIFDTITNYGRETIMAQRYIPEIIKGDKRVILIDGQPVPYGLARIPAAGELRGNLAAGATGVGFELSKHDLFICEQIGAKLQAQGLYFVGIDIIGDYLTEINVTCPTCIQQIDSQFGINISKTYLDCLLSKL
jgi:glutathione synthase